MSKNWEMNEQTRQLIEAMASKLGTTAEHLWGVLVGQAPVSSTINGIILMGFGVLIAVSFLKLKSKSDWDEELFCFIAWILWGLSALVFTVFLCSEAEYIMAGFFNPEYWALHKLLSTGKN